MVINILDFQLHSGECGWIFFICSERLVKQVETHRHWFWGRMKKTKIFPTVRARTRARGRGNPYSAGERRRRDAAGIGENG